MAERELNKLLSPELRGLLERLEASERVKFEDSLKSALQAANEIKFANLWEQLETAVTYWILLLTGVNQVKEMEIAKIFLIWKTFFAKDSAKVKCVQSSEREQFRLCAKHFGTVECPSLILSDNHEMKNFVKIESKLLFTLADEKGSLQRFLAQIHSSIDAGKKIKDIKSDLRSEKFWSGLKVGYLEIKDLVSRGAFSARVDTDI